MSDDQEADARIRALLADLGSGPDGDSMPPEVAARLDETLARLVAEREADGADVVPLRRRRRWPAAAAAAAAAVIVVGVGGAVVSGTDLFGTDTLSSADGGAASKTDERAQDSASASAELPRLSSASFTADVEELLGSDPGVGKGATSDTPDPGTREFGGTDSQSPDPQQGDACRGPRTSAGAVTRHVVYDGRPAVLVVHAEELPARGRASGWLVEAWDCAGTRRLDQTTLAAPPR